MKDALDDLSPLARRDALSASEQQQLELLLKGSEEARLFHELGERFDAEDAAPATKSAASEALVERLMRELPRGAARPSRKARRPVWLLAAAAVLAASVAGAVLGARLLGSRGAPAPSASSASSSSAPRSRSAAGSPSSEPNREAAPAPSDAVPSAAAPSEVTPGDAAPSEPAPSAGAQPSSSARLPSSPTELLSAAGRARRTGQSALAVELLQSLRSRYPASPEAIASDITLGKLELERGAPAAALSHFDDYLRRAAGGALAPEALWGRSQALTKLGRNTEARTSLSQLLERYPNSPYASSARAKLGEGSRP